jgi:hypothetical protein
MLIIKYIWHVVEPPGEMHLRGSTTFNNKNIMFAKVNMLNISIFF